MENVRERASVISHVLTPILSPEAVFKEQDLRLEAELNEEADKSLEDSSIQGSFVAGTQEDQSQGEHQLATPDR
ncbi:hypothetical protein A2U01_0075154, partial [Trifolium medium]|nr:hypothetical protein [Trifolium medium]